MEEIKYYEKDGILYPELAIPEQTNYYIGKYGDMRLAFIKEHRKGTYTTLLTQFKLNEYLHKVDTETAEQVRAITKQLVDSRGIGEELKSADMLRWVAEMNAAKHDAEEIVLREVILSAIIIYHGFYNLLVQTEQFKILGLILPAVTCFIFMPLNYYYRKTREIR